MYRILKGSVFPILAGFCATQTDYEKACERLEQIPPLVSKWKTVIIHDTICYKCNNCKSIYSGDTTYCPHCGYFMKGGLYDV